MEHAVHNIDSEAEQLSAASINRRKKPSLQVQSLQTKTTQQLNSRLCRVPGSASPRQDKASLCGQCPSSESPSHPSGRILPRSIQHIGDPSTASAWSTTGGWHFAKQCKISAKIAVTAHPAYTALECQAIVWHSHLSKKISREASVGASSTLRLSAIPGSGNQMIR